MINRQWYFLVSIILHVLFGILATKPVNAQVVSTSSEDFGNLGAGPRVPNFCSLSRGNPCFSVRFGQGFSLDSASTSSSISVAGDILLNNDFSFVTGGAATLDAEAANLFAGLVARSKVKAKGFGYAVGPVFRAGFGLDDTETTTFADGSTSSVSNNRAFFGAGGTAQLIYKPTDWLVAWVGTDASKNVFDAGGFVFSSFIGTAFKITDTEAGVLAGNVAISTNYGDVDEPSDGFSVGLILFP